MADNPAANGAEEPTILQRSLQEYLQSNKTVKIYVGAERKLWFLNEELLCDRVPFFKGAFKSGFKEGKSKVMELPDDDPEAFGLLVAWVYTEVLCCKVCRWSPGSPEYDASAYVPAHEFQWLKLWVLADKLNLPDLAQNCLNKHSRCLDGASIGPSAKAVAFVCEQTSEDSRLKRHLVKEVADRVLLWNDKFIKGAGIAAAANAAFNQEVMEEIQRFLKLHTIGSCPNGWSCPLHSPPANNQNPENYRGW